MNIKTNEILNDIIHTASQAILAEDEAVKRQAMADIVDALASVIPLDHVGRRVGNPDYKRFILSTNREIAATMARQMDDDDLAQRLENS